MRFNTFCYENQNLAAYLMKNESKLETQDFFAKLRQDEELDPKNFKVRDIWVRDGDWCGEYMVVFGRHFSVRAWQRFNAGDIVAAVMQQLSNNEVAKAITDHPVFWDHGAVSVGEDGFDSVAVIEDDVPFVVIYECGDSYICPKTVLAKSPDMFFHKNTLVLHVSKTGSVSYK